MEKLNQILLVDDDYVDNFLNKRILEEMNVADEVLVCVNSLEALQWLNTHYPELIFLDINMPVMNGLELLETLHQAGVPECPVVILSSSSHPDDLVKAAELKVAYFLVKPLTQDKVRKMMDRCFSSFGRSQEGA
jgi:CheY-like chemotaxis protein